MGEHTCETERIFIVVARNDCDELSKGIACWYVCGYVCICLDVDVVSFSVSITFVAVEAKTHLLCVHNFVLI